MTARAAALAAIRAGLTAVFAVADDRHVFQLDARRLRRRVFLLHRTGIFVLFAARAAHRARPVFAAVSHAAARIFMFGMSRAVLPVHRAMRAGRMMILRLIDGENDRRQSEDKQRRQPHQNSFSHCFFLSEFRNKTANLPEIFRSGVKINALSLSKF
jgi:hypothetical protein